MLRTDDAYADRANEISMLTRDISEFLAELGEIPAAELPIDRVTYHSACSLQHGQKVTVAENPAAGGRVRRHGTGRVSFVLRLRRDLQHDAARHRQPAARPESGQYFPHPAEAIA